MIDKILKIIGLMRISRGERFMKEYASFYLKHIRLWLKEDAPHLEKRWLSSADKKTREEAKITFNSWLKIIHVKDFSINTNPTLEKILEEVK